MIPFQYITSFLLIFIGIYALIYKRNLIKLILALDIIDSGVNLLLISEGYRVAGNLPGTAPIYTGYETLKGVPMVGPLPQALVLTAIVIGVSVTALAISLAINAYRHYGSLDIRRMRRLRG